ncbi:MAG: gephyrin-like molybdotransferase Glp [Rhodanobacteraceae bacterium]
MTSADYPARIGLEQALQIVSARAALHRMPVETIDLLSAYGRVLAQDIRGSHDLPPFANSAMDGFALRGGDLATTGEHAFALVGDVFAGATSVPEIGVDECARVTTGAPIPHGADTVVMKENARVAGNRVFVGVGEKPGANVRPAGEDFAAGVLALPRGTMLRAPQLAVLASLGCARVSVHSAPRAVVIVTGNELVPVDRPLGFGQIHDSNGVMLASLLREAGAQVVLQSHVRDEPDALRNALLDAAAQADLIISSGGVSAGEADHLPDVLAKLGEIHFHKVRLKPGMPTLFGQIGTSLYFGLPGNPVSSAVTFHLFARLVLRKMLGEIKVSEVRRARLAEPVSKSHKRAELLRCVLRSDENGVLWADTHARQGSGMLRGLAESNALALLPEDACELERGDVVTVWPYG